MFMQQSHVELPKSNLRFFMNGFLTNISNPKAVIYFGSVFSIFLSNPILNQMHFVMWLIIGIETFVWLSLVVFIFSFPKFKIIYQNTANWIDGISGGIFTAFGVYLISQK